MVNGVEHRGPEPPIARAIPVETPTPPEPTIMRALPVPDETEASVPEPTAAVAPNEKPPSESAESPEQRQLNYANALFGRKLYDLAVPEYEKFLGLYPDSPDRVSALFTWANLPRASGARPLRTSFQSVLTDYPGERTGRPGQLRPGGNLFQRERLRDRVAAFSSRGGESESVGAGSFRALFRGTLSRKSGTQR